MPLKLPFFLASRFVAAETLGNTLPVIDELKAEGLHVALDMLGEFVDDRSVAAAARDQYIKLTERLSRRADHTGLYGTNISIKLSMMGQKIDERFCEENLLELLGVAKERSVFVRLDMESTDVTTSTLRLFERAYEEYPDHVGIVLQAYLKRTRQDVERMCDLGARVRICKGAYKEPPALAYQRMSEIRARFIDYMKMLISDAHYPGIATHDEEIIQATLEFTQAQQIDRDAFEFQMLYGMRPERQREIAQGGHHMRIYVPYGEEWLPYYTRRLRERKENVWFVAKTLFKR